jgi:hypothetical protein
MPQTTQNNFVSTPTQIIFTYLLTYGAESFLRSCQLCSHSRLPSILWNAKVHYHVHKSPPLVSILSQIGPVHIIPSYLRSILILSTRLFGPRFLVDFRNKFIFYGEELLAPRRTPKLEDQPLSAIRHCLFNTFAATLHIWRPSPPSATWGRAMPWWQGTHLTWHKSYT